MTGPRRDARLVVYTRRECGLCGEMLEELSAWIGGRAIPVAVIDVDSDAADRERFGQRVPLLVVDGRPVLSGRFDPDVLDELFAE